ncbi:MAG: VCBS repeat-containing protein [Byssovorax sp.]
MKRPSLTAIGLSLLGTATIAAACSSTTEAPTSTSTTATATTTTTAGTGGAGGKGSGGEGGLFVQEAGPPCAEDGTPCEDGGICAGGMCCAGGKACAKACCGDAEVCSFQICVTPGAICVDATDCPPDQYCEYSLGTASDAGAPDASCQGGATLHDGKCLPKPPECPPGQDPGPDDAITCLAKCEYLPPPSPLTPALKYAWGNTADPKAKDSVMMAPAVIQLDDDNCDGKVDERDIPEIVFLSFVNGAYNTNGTLHAISIVNGAVVEKWAVPPSAVSPDNPGRSIAAGNIDGVPGNEIVACTADNKVRAHRADGSELWLSKPSTSDCIMPSLADLDQDGKVEVIVEGHVLDGATGAEVVPAFSPPSKANVIVSDVDNPPDGKLDLVTAGRVYRSNGTLLADSGLVNEALLDTWSRAYPAVGDLDKDGVPEIVASYGPAAASGVHRLLVWHIDPQAPGGFKVIRQNVNINGMLSPSLCLAGSNGNLRGGGPPTIADFNGDGTPDVALAGGIGYAVFDGKKLMDPNVPDDQTILWIKQTQDCSSAFTGSSVFDFNGDGKAEVIYADELNLHIYNGPDGTELFTTCNTNGTLFEYPLVADVDNDGQADIVVVSNNYYAPFKCQDGTQTTGVRIFGDLAGNWVRTRRVWNQHAYHVTNVAEDGTIPAVEMPNYTQPKLNNFRQNVQPLGEFSAPDLVVSVFPVCGAGYSLVARVRNIGAASAPAGIPVGFYLGAPGSGQPLGAGPVATTKVLYSAEAEDVVLDLPNAPPELLNGSKTVYAVVDDMAPAHVWHECRVDNNTSKAVKGTCKGAQ